MLLLWYSIYHKYETNSATSVTEQLSSRAKASSSLSSVFPFLPIGGQSRVEKERPSLLLLHCKICNTTTGTGVLPVQCMPVLMQNSREFPLIQRQRTTRLDCSTKPVLLRLKYVEAHGQQRGMLMMIFIDSNCKGRLEDWKMLATTEPHGQQ